VVHLDVLGVPDQTIEELRHAGLLPAYSSPASRASTPAQRGQR
jgi:hypothetical protein